jgi:predicted N-acetyltransferase YhbS
MTGNVVVIDAHRVELHDAFVRFIPRVFRTISFEQWYALGGWPAGYRAFVILDGDEIVANVAVQKMHLIVRGQSQVGWQLGAVGSIPDVRGRGLQRQLLTHVLAQLDPSELVFLFANEDVLDFYPLFGFRRVSEWVYSVDMHIEPQPNMLRRLSVESSADRELMLRIAAGAQPVTERFGATDYGGILFWYWTNFHHDDFYYHADDDAIVIAEEDFEVLRVLDVVAARPVDLASYLPQLLSSPVDHVEFGFTPEKLWPSATPFCEYLESPLFVRGSLTLPTAPFKFPMLAQT